MLPTTTTTTRAARRSSPQDMVAHQTVLDLARARKQRQCTNSAAAAAARTLQHHSGRRYVSSYSSALGTWLPRKVTPAPQEEYPAAATPAAAAVVGGHCISPATAPPAALPPRQTGDLTCVLVSVPASCPTTRAPMTPALAPVAEGSASAAGPARHARLRRFLALRRAARGSASGAAAPSIRSSVESMPIPDGVGHRREPVPMDTPEPAVSHPWQTLVHLGASNFNDAPLSAFMPAVSLRCVPWDEDGGARPETEPGRAEQGLCDVHVADVEVTRFRVEVPPRHTASTMEPLLQALGRTGARTTLEVTPLLDETEDEGEDVYRGGAGSGTGWRQVVSLRRPGPVHQRLARTRLPPLLPPQVTTADRTSAPASGGRSAGGQNVDLDDSASTGRGGSPRRGMAKTSAFEDTLAAVRALQLNEALTRSNVDRWRCYCTAAALYVCLAQAGACDAEALPFVTVGLLPPAELVAGAGVRLELSAALSATAASATSAVTNMPTGESAECARVRRLVRRREAVPVAVTLAMARKGIVRWLPGQDAPANAVPSIVTQPFTDAELFQLLYLQLLLRAFFDVRLPALTWCAGVGEVTAAVPPARAYFRSDRVGSAPAARGGLAFEHPCRPNAWVFFRGPSRVLCLLDLAHAVVPLYATPHELQTTAALPLAGSTADVPCQSTFGLEVVRWAAAQEVSSPRAAAQALAGLFDLFAARYGCPRSGVWGCGSATSTSTTPAPVPPRVFRCSERAAFAAVRAHGGHLARFLVPPEGRAPGVGSASDRALSRVPSAAAFRESQWVTASSRPLSRLPSALAGFAQALQLGSCRAEEVVDGVSAGPLAASCSVHDTAPILAEGLEAPARGSACVLPEPIVIPAESDSASEVGDADSAGEAGLALTVGPSSPFTMQESLVTRWRYYTREGDISVFDGVTTGMELLGFLGRGGSGLVYRGRYGRYGLPVAVKVFVKPESMDHAAYVRESLTDVAFFVLMNQLDDYGICSTCRAHDFIVSPEPPRGLPEADAATARGGGDPSTTQLCYLVTDLMDGTLGRFLTGQDDDFDPWYDTLDNSPLRDGELFQLLFTQLAARAMFDWRILDIMLNNQLRGDNIGFRHVSPPPEQRARLEADAAALAETLRARSYYKGIIVVFQTSADEPVRYLRFPGELQDATAALGPLRFIHFIDLGQGIQPNVRELTARGLIGETVLDSCVQDDGFGRYWPPDELYCRYVEVVGAHAGEVVAWGSQVRLRTEDDALAAMRELLELYYPVYGIPAPAPEELKSHCLLTWSPGAAADLARAYVYRPDPF